MSNDPQVDDKTLRILRHLRDQRAGSGSEPPAGSDGGPELPLRPGERLSEPEAEPRPSKSESSGVGPLQALREALDPFYQRWETQVGPGNEFFAYARAREKLNALLESVEEQLAALQRERDELAEAAENMLECGPFGPMVMEENARRQLRAALRGSSPSSPKGDA